MSRMFTSYETAIGIPFTPPCNGRPLKGTKMLTNIKGTQLGIQVEYAAPIQLYFRLENVCEAELNELITGTALLEILTTTHKVLVSQSYLIADILDPYSNDLYFFIDKEALKPLKKETYNIKVTLKAAGKDYIVFAEKDGYLVIR